MSISNNKFGKEYKKKTELTDKEKKKYWDLFINRSDTYAIQEDYGNYKNIKQELTPDILFGLNTIGGYSLNKENNVNWACIDIDVKKEIADAPDLK